MSAILCPRKNPKIQESCKSKAIRRTGAKGQLKNARRNKNRLGFNLPPPSLCFFGFSNGLSIVNYAERHRAGLRVGTALTEATANFLVNHRMNKSQQMRWSRHGANLLLQVRCAGFNGKLGSSFGQLFQAVDPTSELARAA